MNEREALEREPYRFDLLRVLREYERASPGKPRIGDSATVAEEVVNLSQDPFVEFPAANITRVDATSRGTPRLATRFLGFFGPQGALPLNTTVEAMGWVSHRDDSFVRFVSIFANRFLQLFFRAWADARPIAQHDRPKGDRFARYLGSFAGIGSDAIAERDSIPDIAKLPFAGLVAPRVRSARRLMQLLRGVLGLDVTIEERIGTWLEFEPADRMSLGARGALGVDSFLGQRCYSINDKFRVRIRTASLTEYLDLLPRGKAAERLADLVFFYTGHRYEYDVELCLPARLAPSLQLGKAGQLGWTTWLPRAQALEVDEELYLCDARFALSGKAQAA